MTNTPKDPDMGDVFADARDMLEEELSDLDIPMVDIAVTLMITGDCFDIDPLEFIDLTLPHSPNGGVQGFKDIHGPKEVQLMMDLLYEAIESSTQIPHIRRAVEIYSAMESM